jgi:hypothetical protein
MVVCHVLLQCIGRCVRGCPYRARRNSPAHRFSRNRAGGRRRAQGRVETRSRRLDCHRSRGGWRKP